MDIEGVWLVRYAETFPEPFESETGDPDEQGEVLLKDGIITGKDDFGGLYNGTYKLEEGKITALVEISSDDPENESIFEGVSVPYQIVAEGDFQSPDFFTMKGEVVVYGNKFVLICSRKNKSL